jgi:hypothetical protein
METGKESSRSESVLELATLSPYPFPVNELGSVEPEVVSSRIANRLNLCSLRLSKLVQLKRPSSLCGSRQHRESVDCALGMHSRRRSHGRCRREEGADPCGNRPSVGTRLWPEGHLDSGDADQPRFMGFFSSPSQSLIAQKHSKYSLFDSPKDI